MTHPFQTQSANDNDTLAFGTETITVGRFRQVVQACFNGSLAHAFSIELANQGVAINRHLLAPSESLEEYARWFQQGMDCEVLSEKKQGWQSAKIRIQVSVEVEVDSEATAEEDTACFVDTERIDTAHIEDLAHLLESLVSR